MITSDLANSVFQQTDLEPSVEYAYWVEQMLLRMQINGLVKMICETKIKSVSSMMKLFPKYKWSHRLDPLILNNLRLFETLQISEGGNFNWGLWPQLLLVTDTEDFKECIIIANKYHAGLPYALKIHEGRQSLIVATVEKHRSLYYQLTEMNERSISKDTIKHWHSIKEFL